MSEDTKFDKIRPFYDSEVNEACQSIILHPMMKAIMKFAYPNKPEEFWIEKLKNIHSTHEFQGQIVSHILDRILEESSEGLTTTGFDKLNKNKAYLYISNHRDIILDTSFINLTLYRHDIPLTASAIGDNLVKNPFLHTLSKINRNFLVLRNLSPRELLQSSQLMSEYINKLLFQDNRSVWIAQREGRTKDGNDVTHPGVLKMLSLAAGKEDLVTYFKKLNIVPISISYEYDPTDALKIPELLANLKNEKYIKSENEDFNSLYNGLIGQKKHIHIHAGNSINDDLDAIPADTNANQAVKLIAQILDRHIVGNYKLWPTNYIAYDVLNKTDKNNCHYTEQEKHDFIERFKERIDTSKPDSVEQFLSMYANPVTHKMQILENELVV